MSYHYHIYSDESSHNIRRFRAIAAISLAESDAPEVSNRLAKCISESGLNEFKWSALSSARERLAAIKLINICGELLQRNIINIDVLNWDIQDYRHKIVGRDDNKNLTSMYIHIYKHIIFKRKGIACVWSLYPDVNTIIDWKYIKNTLCKIARDQQEYQLPLTLDEQLNIPPFKIINALEIDSKITPIVQIADLFAGMGAFSHTCASDFSLWLEEKKSQKSLFEQPKPIVNRSNRINERYLILEAVVRLCNSLNLTLDYSNGFKSKNPMSAINFWFYRPQRSDDKAPLHRKGKNNVNR